ncbi:MAG: hypothetical protein VKJ86_08800 [Synechococcus sp.]|nr:hypothetical protein [Synechococcus sp.]
MIQDSLIGGPCYDLFIHWQPSVTGARDPNWFWQLTSLPSNDRYSQDSH